MNTDPFGAGTVTDAYAVVNRPGDGQLLTEIEGAPPGGVGIDRHRTAEARRAANSQPTLQTHRQI
jgi:hypothetical protein